MKITRKSYIRHTPTVLAQQERCENPLWRWASGKGTAREFYLEVKGPKHLFSLTLGTVEATDFAKFILDVMEKDEKDEKDDAREVVARAQEYADRGDDKAEQELWADEAEQL